MFSVDRCGCWVLWTWMVAVSVVALPDNCGLRPVPGMKPPKLYVKCHGPLAEFSKEESFPLGDYVHQLYLVNDCNFTRVPKDAFRVMSAMKQLVVECAHTAPELRIEEGAFNNLKALHTIGLYGNTLRPMPPNGFCSLPSLERLHLNDDNIVDPNILRFGCGGDAALAGNDSDCSTIRYLTLQENKIAHLPSRTFCSLTSLTTLAVTFCGLESIAEDAFFNLNSLKNLDLSDNNLTVVPEMAMSYLTGIYTLDLANNPSLNITGFLQHMPSLKGLYLPNTGLDRLDRDTFAGLDRLESLMLYKNQFESVNVDAFVALAGEPDGLPPGWCEEDAIKPLVMGGFVDDLHARLARVANHTGLRYLNLDSNYLTAIPSVGWLFKLQIFSIAYNRVATLHDDDVSGLHRLQRLNLKYNRIEWVSDRALRNLGCLRQLLLDHNVIRTVDVKAFRDIVAVEELYLQENFIDNITGLFETNVRLQKLDLSGNRLEVISFDMIPLSVRELNISSNLLVAIDAHHGTVPPHLNMSMLDLSRNWLQSISSALFPLSLTILRLNDNWLADVAACSFCNLGILDIVVLSNNRLQTISTEALRISHGPAQLHKPEVTLLGNPLVCDCRMQNFTHDVIGAGHLAISDIRSLSCIRQYARGRTSIVWLVDDEAPNDFLCVTDHGRNGTVPSPCVAYHDRSWHFLQVDCSGRNLTEVPAGIPPWTVHLFLDGNRLEQLTNRSLGRLAAVTEIYLNDSRLRVIADHVFTSLTNLSTLHLEDNFLTSLNAATFVGLGRLTRLYLHANRLRRIDANAFRPLVALQALRLDDNEIASFPFWTLPQLQKVALGQNPWSCSCDFIRQFRVWLQEIAPSVADVNSLFCSFDDHSLSDMALIAFNASHCYATEVPSFLQSSSFPWLVSMVALLAASAIGALLLFLYRREIQVLVYSRYGVRLFHKDAVAADRDKVFDAFLCYSSGDEDFVVQELIPKLEGIDPPFRLCIHQRDFMVGGFITDNILEAVSKSRRSILLLSESFVQSEFCRFEFKTAYIQMLRDRCNRVIVIVFGEVPRDVDPEIELYLKTNTYLTWGDKLFWERLYFAMPNRTERSPSSNWSAL